MVADGKAKSEIDSWNVEHLKLSCGHADGGNTPRSIGSISAYKQGYWPIFWLDADNTYESWHCIEAFALKRRNPSADILAMKRSMYLRDKSEPLPLADVDRNGEHVDMSCYVFYPSSFRILPFLSLLPNAFGICGDEFMLQAIRSAGMKIVGTSYLDQSIQPSVNYFAHQYEFGYKYYGIEMPPALLRDYQNGWRNAKTRDQRMSEACKKTSIEELFQLTGLHF